MLNLQSKFKGLGQEDHHTEGKGVVKRLIMELRRNRLKESPTSNQLNASEQAAYQTVYLRSKFKINLTTETSSKERYQRASLRCRGNENGKEEEIRQRYRLHNGRT